MLCICVFMQKTHICTYLCVYIYLFLLFFVSVSADLKAPCQSSSWHSRTLEATANVVVVPGTAVKRFATVPERTAEGRPEACKCRNTFKAWTVFRWRRSVVLSTTSKTQTEMNKKAGVNCQRTRKHVSFFSELFFGASQA